MQTQNNLFHIINVCNFDIFREFLSACCLRYIILPVSQSFLSLCFVFVAFPIFFNFDFSKHN